MDSTVLGQTDFEHLIFSIISSQSCFIEMDLLQKMFLLLGDKNIFEIGEQSLLSINSVYSNIEYRNKCYQMEKDAQDP